MHPPSNMCFIGPTRVHIPNGISIGSAVFAQRMAEGSYILRWAGPCPSKLPLCMGIWTPSNTWFLGLTQVHNPNSISIGSAVLHGLKILTDRQTDHATPSITIGCIYIHSTAMRPNNTTSLTTPLKTSYIKGHFD